jgi:hypothetical protein
MSFTELLGDPSFVQGVQYAEVDVLANDIKNLAGNNYQLLSLPPVGTYYIFPRIVVEFAVGGVAYVFADDLVLFNNGTPIAQMDGALIVSLVDQYLPINIVYDIDVPTQVVNQYPTAAAPSLGLELGTNGGNPTLGNGTLKFKIWYKIMTFG